MNLSSGISKLVRPCPGRSRGRLAGVSKAEGGKVSWFGAAGDIWFFTVGLEVFGGCIMEAKAFLVCGSLEDVLQASISELLGS